jgi:hypothetical protein
MKIKIILTNLIVVLLIGFASHVYLKATLKSNILHENEKSLQSDRKVFKDLFMLRGYQLMAEVQRKAATLEARAVFDPLPPDEKEAEKQLRARSFIMVDKYAAEELRIDPLFGRKPELVAITNPKGILIARDTDANANVGEKWGEKYDLVKFALNRRAKWDIIEYNGMFLQVAGSPIIRDEGIVGCLLVGFELDNGFMRREGDLCGSDFGILVKNKLNASSLLNEVAREKLAVTLRSEEKSRVDQALAKNTVSEVFELDVNDEPFLAVISPLPGRYEVGQIGFLTLRSLDAAYAPLKHLLVIVAFTVLGALLVILIGALLGAHFIKPIEAMEAEIRKVIEGDYEHRWEIKSSEVGGLSYLTNQMLDVLTGEEEEEAPQAKEAPRRRAKTEEEFLAEGEAKSMSIEELLAEPEEQYYKRVYKEFRELKVKISEDPDAISFTQFVDKLKETEKNILTTQQGSFVRFQVLLQGDKISYKPIISP